MRSKRNTCAYISLARPPSVFFFRDPDQPSKRILNVSTHTTIIRITCTSCVNPLNRSQYKIILLCTMYIIFCMYDTLWFTCSSAEHLHVTSPAVAPALVWLLDVHTVNHNSTTTSFSAP